MLVKWSLHVHYNDKIYITQLIHHLYRLPHRIKPLWTVKLYKSSIFRARFLNGPLVMSFWEGIKKQAQINFSKDLFAAIFGYWIPQTLCKKVPWLQLIVCWKTECETKEVFLHKLSLLLSANFLPNFLQLQMKTIHFIMYFYCNFQLG